MRTFKKLLAIAFACSIASLSAQHEQAQSALNKADRQFFIENKGQWHSDVLYLCRTGGLDFWITKYGMNYTFYKFEKNQNAKSADASRPKGKFDHDHENETLLGHRVLLELQNHNPSPIREGKQKQQGYYNYFIGNDPSKHASFVGLYKEVVIKNVYNGIDLRYYFDKGNLRYDFIVQPYADASQIQFKLHGQDKMYTKGENKLCFTTRFGEVELTDLKTYQNNQIIPSKFVKNDEVWTFALGEYDRRKPLVIDPLVYSTCIGGSNSDNGFGIAVDGSGCAYVTGFTESIDYDVTLGAFQTTYGGGYEDVFVTKVNATGSGLVYSTYIGGSSDDKGRSIAVDGSGCAYVTGETYSTDYDVTLGAFQTTHGGGGYEDFVTKLNDTGTAYEDVFVTKLNATGTALVYSTYIGGISGDDGYGIAVDGSGNAYVTGETYSPDYDVTAGAFQTTYGGGPDVFVTKVNATGSGLVYSTYIGGSDDDIGYGIAVDGSGNAYVTGYTNSPDYDVTAGAFQTTHGGLGDVFVTKVNATGSGLVYSTYIGGSYYDIGESITVDGSGNVYVAGSTKSTDYDVTTGAFQITHGGGDYDVFVTKVNATGSGLVYSTYIGGSDDDQGRSITVDGSGNVYVTGATSSTDYDVTTGAFQTTYGGGYKDVFVTKVNATGSGLVYSTYIGGSDGDWGDSIAVDDSRNIYVTGRAGAGYPLTAGVFQTTHSGNGDIFVTKLHPKVKN